MNQSEHDAGRNDFSGRVLYIEDNPADLMLVQRIFDRYPAASLTTATTGTEGVEYVRNQQFSLILLDVRLPDMEGIDVLEAIAVLPKKTQGRIVVMSADASDERIKEMLDCGASSYITKPFDLKEFDALIASL